ncbi:sensory rhodopsin transducer [Tessaracoccus terricola]
MARWNKPLGHTTWAFAAGEMPDGSTGHEPEFTSRDELYLLNTGDDDTCCELTVFHTDADPVGPYEVVVPGRRVRLVRINNLIDPQAVPLGVPYALTVTSDHPVVAQLRHVDTRQAALGVAITSGLALDQG